MSIPSLTCLEATPCRSPLRFQKDLTSRQESRDKPWQIRHGDARHVEHPIRSNKLVFLHGRNASLPLLLSSITNEPRQFTDRVMKHPVGLFWYVGFSWAERWFHLYFLLSEIHHEGSIEVLSVQASDFASIGHRCSLCCSWKARLSLLNFCWGKKTGYR